MDHYLDLRLQPDPEFPPALLMGALYSKLHRALYDLNASDIGISLPEHETGIRTRATGDVLRLHGHQLRLEQLMNLSWLAAMRDHVMVSSILPVPSVAGYRVVKRRQFNMGSPSRVRRLAKRHDIGIDEARKLLEKPAARKVALPFVQINSRSSGQQFALFIEHGDIQPHPARGEFNHYGLSKEATVPWF